MCKVKSISRDDLLPSVDVLSENLQKCAGNRLSSKLCLPTTANASVKCRNQPAVCYQWRPLKCCQGDAGSRRHNAAPLWFGKEEGNTCATKILKNHLETVKCMFLCLKSYQTSETIKTWKNLVGFLWLTPWGSLFVHASGLSRHSVSAGESICKLTVRWSAASLADPSLTTTAS